MGVGDEEGRKGMEGRRKESKRGKGKQDKEERRKRSSGGKAPLK